MKDEVRMLSVIDSASKHARLLYYIYIGFLLYLVVTALSVKDKQLALGASYINLPFINLSVPLEAFFIVSVILAIALYINLMLYQNKLRRLVADLLKYYNERHIAYDKNKLFPWAINTYGVAERGIYGAVQTVFSGISLWFTLPAALFILSFIYVKKHDELLSYMLVGLVFASLLLVFLFWNKFNKPKKSNVVWDLMVLFVVCSIIVAGWYATCIMVPAINAGKYAWANLNLRNEILAIAPEGSEGNDQYFWVDLEGANLNGADLRNAVLKQSNLSGVKLDNAMLANADLSYSTLANASLVNADMKQSNLKGADLSYTDLSEADLKNARLEEANLYNAILVNAKLEQVNLRDTDLEGANLDGADMKNANLTRVDLHNASLRNANMESANLEDSNLSLANLEGAELSRAQLRGAEFKNSNLNSARLVEADLNGASFDSAQLRFTDLSGADLTDAKLNSANLEGASLTNAKLNGALLLGVGFRGASFANTELDQTFLYQADLRNTDGLTREKLCGTGTLWEAKLDSDILEEIKDVSSGCPEKLTKESYEKWQEARIIPDEFLEEG